MLADRPQRQAPQSTEPGLRDDAAHGLRAGGVCWTVWRAPIATPASSCSSGWSTRAFGLDELKQAVAEDRLALLPVERVLGGRYTAAEIEERTGLPADLAAPGAAGCSACQSPGPRTTTSSPTPTSRPPGRSDVPRRRLRRGGDRRDHAGARRGDGAAARPRPPRRSSTPSWSPATASEDVAAAVRGAGRGARPDARAGAGGARSAPTCARACGAGIIGRAEREAGRIAGAQEMAVCFADLVGFTRLGGEVESAGARRTSP